MYDDDASQYYLRARFYNPAIGRFLQEDTYRGDGLNLYAYCANNPVMYYDPSGRIGLCPDALKQPGNENPATDPYRKTDPVTISGERAIDQGHSYEGEVRNIYGDLLPAQRKYANVVDGQNVKGVAGNVVLDKNIAIEAKYVDDWTTSIRNPESKKVLCRGQLKNKIKC